jgi:cytochrome c2
VLNQVGNRRSREWLRRWLKDPAKVKPGTVMPNLGLSDGQVEELVGALVQMRRPVDGAAILSAHAAPEAAGRALFDAYDCLACHRLGAEGRFVGPNLTWLGKRKSLSREKAWLTNPEASKPGTFMPNFGLSPGEVEALATFVTAQRGQLNDRERVWEAKRATATARERGRMIVERFACESCHGENLDSGERNPNAAPDQKVPGIHHSYPTLGPDRLRSAVLSGSVPKKLDPTGPAPPLSCPSWQGSMTDAELEDLLAYLKALAPKSKKRT